MDISSLSDSESLFSAYITGLGQTQKSEQAKPGSDEFFEEMSSKAMGKLDSDDDGLLSLDESKLDEETFDALDTDHDGMVSAAELQAGMKNKGKELLTAMSSDTDFMSALSQNSASTAQAAASYAQQDLLLGFMDSLSSGTDQAYNSLA